MWGWKPSITYNIAPIPWAKPSRNLHNSKIGARICMTGSLSHKSQSGQGVTCDNSQSQKRQLNTDLFGSQHWTKIELESIPRKWGPLPNLHEPNPTAHTAHYSTLGIMPSAKSFPRQPLSPINKVQVIQQHLEFMQGGFPPALKFHNQVPELCRFVLGQLENCQRGV